MDNNNENKKEIFNQPQDPYPKLGWWKIFIAFILIWIIASYLMKSFEGPVSANIPYSKFKKEVSGKNVSQITIQGDQISGEFHNKFIIVNKAGDTTAYKYFATIKPDVQDPELMKLLENNNVIVKAEQQSNNTWITYFIFLVLPWIVIIGYFIYMRRKIQGKGGTSMMGGGGILGIGKSTAKRFKKGKSNVTFNDVAGLANAKKDLQERVKLY